MVVRVYYRHSIMVDILLLMLRLVNLLVSLLVTLKGLVLFVLLQYREGRVVDLLLDIVWFTSFFVIDDGENASGNENDYYY